MSTELDKPKVFISYSWKPAQHQLKVIDLAERLSRNGVHVIIDVWDLKEGQDKNQFMERMVTDPDIKRVLLICNKDYKEKADGRKGGVGTESMIMSSEIYSKAEQTKFIPLIFEADESGNAYTPVFVHSRIYLDFKDADVYEDSYEQLVRNIFDAPARKRPPIGVPPAYITDKEPIFLPTANRVAGIRTAFANERNNAPLLVKEYYQLFLNALKEFAPKESEFNPDNFIELTISKIEQTIPLRDDFITFLEVYCNATPNFDKDVLHDFLEHYAQYFVDNRIDRPDHYIGSIGYDCIRFFTYELLLYFTATMLRHGRYDALGEFLYDSFTLTEQYTAARAESFLLFNPYNYTLDKFYKEKFQSNRRSPVADKVKERAGSEAIFEELKQADAVLHIASVLHRGMPDMHSNNWLWRPETAVYNIYKLPFFEKLVSMRYFNKVKKLLGVDSLAELKGILTRVEADSTYKNFSHQLAWEFNLPALTSLLDIEKIGSYK